jgi:hypothetical protein
MEERYQVVCYKRFECPAPPMTLSQAQFEWQCLQLSHPENIYVVEEVKK